MSTTTALASRLPGAGARAARRGTHAAGRTGRLAGRGARASYRAGRRVGRVSGAAAATRVGYRFARRPVIFTAAAAAAAGVVGVLVGRRTAGRGEERTATPPSQPRPNGPNDATLANTVRSEIFRPADAPKGSVNVNVEHGAVYLRGEVESTELGEELAARAGRVDGVTRVVNLLHQPGETPPTRDDGRASRSG